MVVGTLLKPPRSGRSELRDGWWGWGEREKERETDRQTDRDRKSDTDRF